MPVRLKDYSSQVNALVIRLSSGHFTSKHIRFKLFSSSLTLKLILFFFFKIIYILTAILKTHFLWHDRSIIPSIRISNNVRFQPCCRFYCFEVLLLSNDAGLYSKGPTLRPPLGQCNQVSYSEPLFIKTTFGKGQLNILFSVSNFFWAI